MPFTLAPQDATTSSEPVRRVHLNAAEVPSSDVKLWHQYFHNLILPEHQARAQCNLYFTEAQRSTYGLTAVMGNGNQALLVLNKPRAIGIGISGPNMGDDKGDGRKRGNIA
jgi:hypothetical protein